MITAAELSYGTYLLYEGQYCVVEDFELLTAGGKAGSHYNVKLRNMKTGAVTQPHFKPTDKLTDLDVTITKKQFLYEEGDSCVFMDVENYEQFSYPKKNLGKSARFLTEQVPVNALYYHDELLTIELPRMMDLVVTQTAAGVHGQGSDVPKPAVLANGVEVQVPHFIKEGDRIRVDTMTGQYVERLKEPVGKDV